MKAITSTVLTSHDERRSTYLNLVKIRNSAPNMSQLDVLYESDDGSLLDYSSDDSEIENGHQSFILLSIQVKLQIQVKLVLFDKMCVNVQDLFQAVTNLMYQRMNGIGKKRKYCQYKTIY